MATARPSWVVPVALVPGDPADLQDVRVRTVRAEVPLTGIATVRLTTGRLGTQQVLAAVDPVRGDVADADASLGDALASLGRPVPVLAVGTALQRRVLAALAAVPVGTVVTYGELAARAGAPRAARAAARVMSTNRVPLVLPCHRVVPAGGALGAYGWGADVKAALLAAEGVAVAPTVVAAGRVA